MSKRNPQKATYALKHMEAEFKKLKQEVRFKESIGFEQCMNIFVEHFGDMLRREKEYNLKEEIYE
jgi:hypothetical protein